ncbi:MAG: glycosyltransferase family 1 protein [Actinomycetota bacterium]|jgi:glycosyltransferase involved in cell wall biosynthesis|nr:glycosyltransferase family 1 protein [Actinomycetota bacterium]MDA8279853.1 glycosyltransferase family 1 protein [Actinomycetota bacterium]
MSDEEPKVGTEPGFDGVQRPGFDGPSLAVSVDATAVPERPVGAGRYVVELVRALARRDDVRLTVWCRRGDAARWESPGLAVVPCAPPSRPSRLVWEQAGLARRLRTAGVAVHHGPHYTMPVLCPVPSVVTVHDLTLVEHPEWHERSKVVVFRRAIALARRRATAIVCPSAATATRLAATGGASGRVFVVPHGVDHDRFGPHEAWPGADAAALRGVGVRPPYLLFLGTLEPRKAVPVLVDAFDRLAGVHRDLTLVLAGGAGWGSDEVERSVAAAVHRSRIVRTGYVAETAVPALLRRAAAVCYPAIEEGFGLPALEAAACGTPLVTTAGSVMAEMVGDAAVLAEAGSAPSVAAALAVALAGGADGERRRAAGLAAAAERTWAASAAGHVEAYRWAAGRQPPRAGGT